MKDDHVGVARLRAQDTGPSPLPAAEDVLAFLAANPDFFLRNEQALCDLELPHRAGAAVSLVERQVSLLRERNIESRQRLNRLLETARENDLLFGRTRRLILALLEAATLADVTSALHEALRRDFGVEQVRLLLVEVPGAAWPAETARIPQDEAAAALKGLFRAGLPVVGPLRAAECTILFADDAAAVQSAAVVPVGAGTPFALLAAGSSDPRRFHAEMGTLFLEFIGEVLARLLPRFSTRD
jgi:hypothetical protein